jgi:hypothetical protein
MCVPRQFTVNVQLSSVTSLGKTTGSWVILLLLPRYYYSYYWKSLFLLLYEWNIVVGRETELYGRNNRGIMVRFPAESKYFFLMSKPALGPIPFRIHRVPRALSSMIKTAETWGWSFASVSCPVALNNEFSILSLHFHLPFTLISFYCTVIIIIIIIIIYLYFNVVVVTSFSPTLAINIYLCSRRFHTSPFTFYFNIIELNGIFIWCLLLMCL